MAREWDREKERVRKAEQRRRKKEAASKSSAPPSEVSEPPASTGPGQTSEPPETEPSEPPGKESADVHLSEPQPFVEEIPPRPLLEEPPEPLPAPAPARVLSDPEEHFTRLGFGYTSSERRTRAERCAVAGRMLARSQARMRGEIPESSSGSVNLEPPANVGEPDISEPPQPEMAAVLSGPLMPLHDDDLIPPEPR